MSDIHPDNPAWADLLYVLRSIRDSLETIADRM